MPIPEGFVEFDGHYYRYVKVLANYEEARAGAAALGGHLATITSAAENAFLASLIAGQDLGAWLGGSDAGTEGSWQWTEGPEAGTTFWNGDADGGAVAGRYTNWNPGEPTVQWNGLEEDHFHMMANSDKWNDASGYWATMGYFVEIEGDGSEPPANTAPAITSNGGGATAALSVPENGQAVTTVAASDPDGDALTFAIVGGADAARFSIVAGTGVLSFVSAPDFENPADSGGDNVYSVQVRVSDGRGGADTQTLDVTVTDVDETTDPGDPPGFHTFNGHLYRYVKGLYTFAEAQAGAAAFGGHLATITSAAENAFLASLIAGQDLGAWLGGSDTGTEGVWRWTEGPEAGTTFWTGGADGSAVAGRYTNWNAGEPNGIWNGLEEDHFHMMANSDKWNDASGHWSTMGYFVEIGEGGEPPANTAPAITSNGGSATAALSVPENRQAVTTVAATDDDGDTLTFAIVGGTDAARFSIEAGTGALSFVSAPDFEFASDSDGDNVYSVQVRVSDGRGGTDTQALAVTVTDVDETTDPGDPPPGFSSFGGHFYKFVNASASHAAAEAAAAADGGYLATITSAEENAFLADLMADGGAWGYGGWLGGSDAASEGVWRWTEGPEAGEVFWNGLADGSAPQGAYTNWLPGEPSQYQGAEEDYLHMLAGTDRWNDIPDSYHLTMGYFVEIG